MVKKASGKVGAGDTAAKPAGGLPAPGNTELILLAIEEIASLQAKKSHEPP